MRFQFLLTTANRPALLSVFSIIILVSGAGAQQPKVPSLGSPVPKQVMIARRAGQECLTDIKHHDPCASVEIRGMLFTIAWERQTKAITYIFTDDPRVITDSELSVGGGCTLVDETEKPFPVSEYIKWLITPYWADTIGDLSGEATWYAAIHRDTPQAKGGTVVAFVQSRYLRLPRDN